MIRFHLLVVGLAWLMSASAWAKPLSREEVPEPLQPWVDWVLLDARDHDCPFIYNDFQHKRCAWPTHLALQLDTTRGEFTQTWQVYADSWISLPGNQKHWPQEVTVDGESALVTERGDRPLLHLTAGRHEIRGRFAWERLPESLRVPPDTGLVSLSIRDKPVAFPDLDPQGRLWLRARDTGGRDKAPDDRLELNVFRRVIDEIPLRVVTRIDLDVAGSQREILLGRALPDGFIPLQLASPLPTRLEPDGRLRVQLRPGRWHIELTARHPGELSELPLAASPKPWPEQEVWVFDARNHLRLVEVKGVPPVDPRQTNLPSGWRNLPAFRVKPGDTLRLKLIRRGDPDPEPDQLALKRQLWLDFDGGGYTFQDAVSGSMTRGWRLEARPEIRLGQVTVDGRPQFITRLPGSERQGVEVRRGSINLTADSRYQGDITNLPAVGWEHDFRQVGATLHLPPGWELFSAAGIDNVPGTWLQRWTLLDLFLVLIAALAVNHLWGWRWGLLALATLALLWHEPDAPRFVWLNILAAIALLRVLPQGRLQRSVRWYRNLSLIALVLIAVPFMVQQVRTGLFPQLDRPWQQVEVGRPVPVSAPVSLMAPQKATRDLADEVMSYESAPAPMESRVAGAVSKPELVARRKLARIDPKALVQTGPGLPQWQWRSIPLSWNGPVERNQRVNLVLLSPEVNLVLNLLRVILLAILAAVMLKPGDKDWRKQLAEKFGSSAATPTTASVALLPILALSLPLLFGLPQDSDAAFPDQAMLDELRTRLLAPAECLPGCAQIPRMRLQLAAEDLTLRLEIHAAEAVAIPLPAKAQQWLPAQVAVDGKPTEGLFRTPKGELWLELEPGRYQVLLSGPLPPRNTVQLPLPLRPRWVGIRAEDWTVAGVHEDGMPDAQLELTRIRAETGKPELTALKPSVLPPFVRVERTLRLGLDWRVETQVVRVSPPGRAVVIEVPLMEGESVTTEGIRVSDGKALVNMPPRQSRLAWHSVLKKHPQLDLLAPDSTEWTEVWRADVSPIWHAETSGIPVIHHQASGGRWLPEWRPWPGESISLNVTRPEGIEGPTLTLDDSRLEISPGKRATDASLKLSIRSSQGGQHSLTLPQHARLQTVTINGRPQPIRQEGRTVTLPITPGKQTINLSWREPSGIGSLFRTPALDLGVVSVNSATTLKLGQDRWSLLLGGPRLGPAVQFWGVLLVIVLIALGLGRTRIAPLRTWHWLLLGIGLSQSPIWVGVTVVGWLLLLGGRARLSPDTGDSSFNLAQIGLAVLTLLALNFLFSAIQQGLLGLPDMQITGNGSSAYQLNWYQDRSDPQPPQAWLFSVPLLTYRLLMLAWALWLAFALLRWLRWGWGCYSTHGLWRKIERKPKAKKAPEKAVTATSDKSK